jgi:hypothetical protein
MYAVATINRGERLDDDSPKFFRHLLDARAYARQQAQEPVAIRAEIYDVSDIGKISRMNWLGFKLSHRFRTPVEFVCHKATEDEARTHQWVALRKECPWLNDA